MVLVDTTVWVDFFRDASGSHVEALESFLTDGEDVCVCGLILTEILQGIRADNEYRKTKNRLDALIYLPMTRDTFVTAAATYRGLCRRGITIRKPIDCIIASVAIEHNVPLLHNDRDFAAIEKHCSLKVWH